MTGKILSSRFERSRNSKKKKKKPCLTLKIRCLLFQSISCWDLQEARDVIESFFRRLYDLRSANNSLAGKFFIESPIE